MAAQPRNVFEWSKLYFQSEDRSLHETKATMAALMTYADFNALTCYPSQTTLSRVTGVHVSTVKRHIDKNVKAGWLVKLEQGNSYKRSTKYRLSVPTPSTNTRSTGSTDEPQLYAPVQSTPSTDARSTPSTGEPLTNHVTTHRTTKRTNQNNNGSEDPDTLARDTRDEVSNLTPSGVGPFPVVNSETGSQEGSSARPCGASRYSTCKRDPFGNDWECSTHAPVPGPDSPPF